MKRAKQLGRRYIRTLSDALRSAFNKHRFQQRVAENVLKHNALLRKLCS